VAQWTTRLTTNQKIAGSIPARIEYYFFMDKKVSEDKVNGSVRQGDRPGLVSEVLWRNGQRI
jgi:hypothetical protein